MPTSKQSSPSRKSGGEMPERGTAAAAPHERNNSGSAGSGSSGGKRATSRGEEPITKQNRQSSEE
jgi:hypothetical protein